VNCVARKCERGWRLQVRFCLLSVHKTNSRNKFVVGKLKDNMRVYIFYCAQKNPLFNTDPLSCLYRCFNSPYMH
jgi:hypothetical protein